ncbi:hypothetical protein ATER59S_00383 [Aquamicrobium terrae]
MRDLAHNGAEAAMPQAFLHAGQNARLVAGLEVDHPVGCKAGLGDGRCEDVRLGNAPQHTAFGAGGDPCCKKSGSRPVNDAMAAAGDFMQRAARQPTAGESRIDFGEPERKHRFGASGPPFEAGDPLSKLNDR